MSARILVVEDEEALTTLLRYNLDAEGYEVETVARGDEADTRLKERPPDRSRPDRIPPARILPRASRPRLQPRAVARQRLGPRHLYRRAHRRRPHRPPAQTAQSRPRAGPDPYRPRRGICARRSLCEGR